MNRKKKKETIHKQRLKKAKAKLAPKKKSTYISKAKRAELEAQEREEKTLTAQEATPSENT